jgi:hypothetical protein
MIKILARIDTENSSRHECPTVADAHALFSDDLKMVIARCSTDEECMDLLAAVYGKSKTSAEKGLLDTVMVWTSSSQFADGDGWRIIFEQQEALTVKGMQKQQAAQQAQMQAQQQALQRMMGGGGGGGFQHPANGQRGVRR